MQLANLVDIYVYVSSISVYRDLSNSHVNESSELLTLPEENIEDIPNYYGALKAHCELELERIMPGRILIIRPGLIVGPLDSTDRFTYWPLRTARGGEVLAPGNPEDHVQFIDARDLAEWTLNMTEIRKTGIYQAAGPGVVMTMRELLESGRAILGSDSHFTWIDEKFLLNHDVKAWTEMPLWLPNAGEYAQYRGMNQSDCRKARAAGLTFRPLSETIRDIVEWNSTRLTGTELIAGLSPDRENKLLALWHDYQGKHGL
jgi:2'-hydroxyisoflavone reductase